MLKIATCQFGVGRFIKRNSRAICGFMRKAGAAGAERLCGD